MASTISALFYLWSRSAWNMVMGRLRRLKQPKYLFGAMLALGYLYLVFVLPQRAQAARRAAQLAAGQTLPPPRDLSDMVTSGAAVLMLGFFLVVWLWRRPRASLHFSEAEIAYLFPGPVTHAALVHYSLIRGQVALLFSAMFLTLFTAAWEFIPSSLWMRFVGWWLIVSVIALHVTASGFVLTRLLNRGLAQWQRQLCVLALLALAVWVMTRIDPHLRLPTARETSLPELFVPYALDQIGSGPLYWLLWPWRILVAPLVAADAPAFLLALGPTLTVYALHYFWAFSSELPDQEATLANAEKRATQLANMRKGNIRLSTKPARTRRDPFKLSAHGSPFAAFLWKNLLSTREYLNLRTLLVLAAVLIAWDLWMGTTPRNGVIAMLPTMIAFLVGFQAFLVGAQFVRQDLRSDLDNADLIKTWPLQGWQIVLGELLAPTFILTGVLWLCLLQIGLVAESPRQPWLTPQLRLVAGLAFALLLPLLCAVQLLVANAAVVLFPAWMKSSGQGQGIEVVGQRILFLAGQWFAMLIALMPALLFGLLVYIPLSWYMDAFAILPAAAITALVLAGELAWGINWLGERFDAYDLSA